MAAGLRPDPLGELKRSPDTLDAIWGLLLRGGEGKEEEEGKEKGRERGEREGAPHFSVCSAAAVPIHDLCIYIVCNVFRMCSLHQI